MSGSSQKQTKELIKRIGALAHGPTANVERLTAAKRILELPVGVAVTSDSLSEEPEEKNIYVTFSEYRDDICQLPELTPVLAPKLTNELKLLTSNKLSQVRNFVTINPIYNNKEYKKLYSSVSKDAEIQEIIYDHVGRIFGHFAQNYFSVVAITTVRHLNTS